MDSTSLTLILVIHIYKPCQIASTTSYADPSLLFIMLEKLRTECYMEEIIMEETSGTTSASLLDTSTSFIAQLI